MTTQITLRTEKGGRLSVAEHEQNLKNLRTTADAAAVKTDVDTALAGKVDKVTGKQLSTEDFTTAEKSKLNGVEAGATKYIHPATHSISEVSGLQTALDSKATPADVDTRIQAVVGAAPVALDTLQEIATQLAADESAAAALTTTVAGKADKTYVDGEFAKKLSLNPDGQLALSEGSAAKPALAIGGIGSGIYAKYWTDDTSKMWPVLSYVAEGIDVFKIDTWMVNVGLGDGTLTKVTTGLFNNAIGQSALSELTSGKQNVAFGRWAGYNITTGIDNVCVGTSAGMNVIAGSNNSFLGKEAGFANSAYQYSNATAIGAGALVNSNNTVVLGRTTDKVVIGSMQDDGSGAALQVTGAIKATSGFKGNADSATKLAAPTTLTIGGTGKSVDGSASVSWSLAEMGAVPASSANQAGGYLALDTRSRAVMPAGTQHRVANLGNISGNVAIDFSFADQFIATITGNTTFSFINTPSTNQGQSVVLRLTNAGAYSVVFPGSTKYPGGSLGLLTTSGVDLLFVIYDAFSAGYVISALKDVK